MNEERGDKGRDRGIGKGKGKGEERSRDCAPRPPDCGGEEKARGASLGMTGETKTQAQTKTKTKAKQKLPHETRCGATTPREMPSAHLKVAAT
jgi:hypothetical protein